MKWANVGKLFQCGFKPLRSTKTALLKVFNDLRFNLDSGNYAFLFLLDLTVAFDTVDHTIFLSHFDHCGGIEVTALEWFKPYLADRSSCVQLGQFSSSVALT